MKRILTFIAAIFCLCSCEKEETVNHWLAGHWYGEYETTVTDNDTGEIRTVGAMIDLVFSADGTEWSSKLNYAGKISEGKLILSWPDEVGRVVELKKMMLE